MVTLKVQLTCLVWKVVNIGIKSAFFELSFWFWFLFFDFLFGLNEKGGFFMAVNRINSHTSRWLWTSRLSTLPCTIYIVPSNSTVHHVPSTMHSVPCTMHCTMQQHHAQCTMHSVPCNAPGSNSATIARSLPPPSPQSHTAVHCPQSHTVSSHSDFSSPNLVCVSIDTWYASNTWCAFKLSVLLYIPSSQKLSSFPLLWTSIESTRRAPSRLGFQCHRLKPQTALSKLLFAPDNYRWSANHNQQDLKFSQQ